MAMQTMDASSMTRGQEYDLNGDWTITGTIPDNVVIRLAHGNLIADDTGMHVRITADQGNIQLQQVGYSNTLKAAGLISFTHASKHLEAIAGGKIFFASVEDGTVRKPVIIKGRSVAGKKTGFYADVTATAGDIEIEHVGYTNQLNAMGGGIKFNTASKYLQANAAQQIVFTDVEDGTVGKPVVIKGRSVVGKKTGFYADVTATTGNIEIERVGYTNQLNAMAGGIQFGTAAKHLQANAAQQIVFGTVEDGSASKMVTLKGSHVNGESTGFYARVSATHGDIHLKNAGYATQLDAARNIQLGTASDHVDAKAGGTIYYEKKAETTKLNAPELVVRPWSEAPAPAPLKPTTVQPTTTINQAEIIERQRRAALEDGQGI